MHALIEQICVAQPERGRRSKIERYHSSMKNVVKLRNYYYPWEMEQALEAFVEYYNHERYH